jgi:hypothetical protein
MALFLGHRMGIEVEREDGRILRAENGGKAIERRKI